MAYASTSEWLPNLQHWFTTIDVFHVPTSTAFTSSTSTPRLPHYTAPILHYHSEITFWTLATSDNISGQLWIHHQTL